MCPPGGKEPNVMESSALVLQLDASPGIPGCMVKKADQLDWHVTIMSGNRSSVCLTGKGGSFSDLKSNSKSG